MYQHSTMNSIKLYVAAIHWCTTWCLSLREENIFSPLVKRALWRSAPSSNNSQQTNCQRTQPCTMKECKCCLTHSNLCKQGVELLVGIVVTALGQVWLDLLAHLLLIQVPAVVIVRTCASRRVRGPWRNISQYYDTPDICSNRLKLLNSKSKLF
jgi:hypothetical protein